MYAWSALGRCVAAAMMVVAIPASVGAQAVPPPAAPRATQPTSPALARVTMDDAVRLARERNHQLLATRLNVDISRADEITAGLKPNPVLTSTNENFPVFNPSDAHLGELRLQPEFRRVRHLSVRAWRQARQAHAGRARHHRYRREVSQRRRTAAGVPDRAGVHQRPARQLDARPRQRESEEFQQRAGGQPRASAGGRPRRGGLLQNQPAEAAVRAGSLIGRSGRSAGQGRAASERGLRKRDRRFRRRPAISSIENTRPLSTT